MARKDLSLRRGEKVAKLSSFAMAIIGLTKGVVGLFSGSMASFQTYAKKLQQSQRHEECKFI